MTEESSFIAGNPQVQENIRNEKSEGNSSKWKDAFIIGKVYKVLLKTKLNLIR